jgi:hypothetical protein
MFYSITPYYHAEVVHTHSPMSPARLPNIDLSTPSDICMTLQPRVMLHVNSNTRAGPYRAMYAVSAKFVILASIGSLGKV